MNDRISVEYGDVNRLVADLRGLPAEAARRASTAIRKTALDIEADAKAFSPIDTGFLRSSIGFDVDRDGLGAVIGPTAEYAPAVEWGTSRAAPRAFLGPAFDRRATDLYDALERMTEGLL